jgi:hypothetical protein
METIALAGERVALVDRATAVPRSPPGSWR